MVEEKARGENYGAKLGIDEARITSPAQIKVSWYGNAYIRMEGDFGGEAVPVIAWRFQVPMDRNAPMDLWPEYIRDESISLQLRVRVFRIGSWDQPVQTLLFSEEDMREQLRIGWIDGGALLSCTLLAKGKGVLKTGALHYRVVPPGEGIFLEGGRRFADDNREEFYSFFDPADHKPPLNVYFSGYRTAEGFEGYPMMKRLGAPFLLIGDPRLEGGAFYLGSERYEEAVADAILGKLEELHFTSDQLILSGLSMGTYGALYYAAKLKPHAVVIGKPLMNAGNIAANEQTIRPAVFATALDVLLKTEGALDTDAVSRLNERMWEKVREADFSATQFAVAYMMHDDYDPTAYQDLLDVLSGQEVSVIGKGIIGRHNDNSAAVTRWFLSRYRNILREDFGREDRLAGN